MSLATWYQHQYSTWNRTRRLQQTPYLARTDTNASRAATALAQGGQTGGTGAADANDILNQANGENIANANGGATVTNNNTREKKLQEPLFGPNIGFVSGGPAWTVSHEKKVVMDDLTPEIVSGWLEKSKEPSQPTTTLQALVNLKRPSLRLSPLSEGPTSPPTDPAIPTPNQTQHHSHGLEFSFDCDAPKCGIHVYVFLPKDHPDAPPHSVLPGGVHAKVMVFETVVEGGFGRVLAIEDGAVLELDRFEKGNSSGVRAGSPVVGEEEGEGSSVGVTQVGADVGNGATGPAPTNTQRRRFTPFQFRKRSANRSVAGPALAVVDAEPTDAHAPEGATAAGVNGTAKKEGKDDGKAEAEKGGVRVMIKLTALDEQGTELAAPNEQVTYLHVVRLGVGERGEGGAVGSPAPEGEEEDRRPWVVKVVKREATIGPHTFHLHEIYGLTSSSAQGPTHEATASAQLETAHTYPPSAGLATPAAGGAEEEDPQSECLLCLSSPREVVLLPCRHLVACKDCALNMVEFGAGGNITHAVDEAGGTATGVEGGTSSTGGGTVPVTASVAPAAPTPSPVNARRKRKAKGWFCPVCRQPYTSLLRITTSSPPVVEGDTEKEGEGADGNEASPESESGSGGNGNGILGRPGVFLRGLSFARGHGTAASTGDVEREAGLNRVGA